MLKMSTMPRLAAVALTALLGVIALSASALAQPATPHLFFGSGLEAGDVVGLGDASATADADGEWSIQSTAAVADEVDENSFTLNGAAATASYSAVGESATSVTLTAAPDDAMLEEDSSDGDSMGEDSMGEDSMGEDSMMGDDDAMLDEDSTDEDNGFPGTGTGGLADNGGLSAGLIGLLIAIGAVAITGLGLRRVRNRA